MQLSLALYINEDREEQDNHTLVHREWVVTD